MHSVAMMTASVRSIESVYGVSKKHLTTPMMAPGGRGRNELIMIIWVVRWTPGSQPGARVCH